MDECKDATLGIVARTMACALVAIMILAMVYSLSSFAAATTDRVNAEAERDRAEAELLRERALHVRFVETEEARLRESVEEVHRDIENLRGYLDERDLAEFESAPTDEPEGVEDLGEAGGPTLL